MSKAHSTSSSKSASVADGIVTRTPELRILLVEDHSDSRRVIGNLLSHSGYNVSVADCAGTATPPPAETGHKITGGGRLGPDVNFGFVAKETPMNGALSYHDNSANVDVHSSGGIDCSPASSKITANPVVRHSTSIAKVGLDQAVVVSSVSCGRDVPPEQLQQDSVQRP